MDIKFRKKDDYICGISTEGIFYEGFFSKYNLKTLLIIPGDCFGSWAYVNFARDAYEKGKNVLILNFINGYRSRKVKLKNISNSMYLHYIQKTIEDIKRTFNLKDKDITYIGYSRGAFILQMFINKSDHGILVYPLIKYENKYVDKRKVIKKLLNIINIYKFKLPFKTFVKRFFNNEENMADIKAIYKKSDYVYTNILFDDEAAINYEELRDFNIKVILSKDDRAVKYEETISILERIRDDYNINFDLKITSGPHCSIITNPKEITDLVLEG